ncbi:UNVERIFIED_CONTAM: Ribonuclease [Trichonephila clavipes]
MASVRFLGAAQEVTGSCHLLSSPAVGKVLLDCGMHQGGDAVDRLRDERFGFQPAEIDAVILSHAHIDHSGLLPKLVSEGFRGPIYCTRATADLLQVMLNDAAGLYERDLERENLRRSRRGAPELRPAYTRADVERVFKQCAPQRYRETVAIGEAGTLTLHDAGHILGSAIVELTLQEQGREKRLVFSGDLGKKDSVLLFDPEVLTRADVVMMEGTYGDRDHRTLGNTVEQFEQVLHEAWERGGNPWIALPLEHRLFGGLQQIIQRHCKQLRGGGDQVCPALLIGKLHTEGIQRAAAVAIAEEAAGLRAGIQPAQHPGHDLGVAMADKQAAAGSGNAPGQIGIAVHGGTLHRIAPFAQQARLDQRHLAAGYAVVAQMPGGAAYCLQLVGANGQQLQLGAGVGTEYGEAAVGSGLGLRHGQAGVHRVFRCHDQGHLSVAGVDLAQHRHGAVAVDREVDRGTVAHLLQPGVAQGRVLVGLLVLTVLPGVGGGNDRHA